MKERKKWKKDKRQGVKAERGALVSPPLGSMEREFRLFVHGSLFGCFLRLFFTVQVDFPCAVGGTQGQEDTYASVDRRA